MVVRRGDTDAVSLVPRERWECAIGAEVRGCPRRDARNKTKVLVRGYGPNPWIPVGRLRSVRCDSHGIMPGYFDPSRRLLHVYRGFWFLT